MGYWIYAAARVPFADDPLLGNRMVSVLAGTLCVLVLYRVAFLCAGPLAGSLAALLYSVLPYGVFYDRIAYIDTLVNLFGVLLVYATLRAFGFSRLSWSRTLGMGLTLGVALFIKTTILLFALAPLVLGLCLWRGSRLRFAAHLTAAYGIAALFPLICRLAVPPGPMFGVLNVLVHHTDFFTPFARLVQDPLLNLQTNGPLLAGYAASYLTYGLAAAAVAATVVLVWFRNRLPVAILLVCVVPFLLASVALEYFPSRYGFPHAWPLLLVVACAAAIPVAGWSARVARAAAITIVLGGMAIQSGRILMAPDTALHAIDAEEFLGSGPYSGSGVLEAIALLQAQARNGAITVLTDPWWGPPTDTVFAYLNESRGTRVYEAWWLQMDGAYPLVPAGEMPVWKSQYQRIPAGEVNFSALARLYYLTDTSYHTPDDVHRLCPAARLLRRFPKRDPRVFIDVYRLN